MASGFISNLTVPAPIRSGGFQPAAAPPPSLRTAGRLRPSLRPTASWFITRYAHGARSGVCPLMAALRSRSRNWRALTVSTAPGALWGRGSISFSKDQSPHQIVRFFSFATRQVTPLLSLEGELIWNSPDVALSSDGRRLLIARLDQETNDRMLIKNFR